MMDSAYAPLHPMMEIIDKPCPDWTRQDLLKVIETRRLRRITFHYTGLDGKLKELKTPVLDRSQADRILARGERVDGSSLFSGLVGAGLSDLYVLPLYRSAFINPLDEQSLNLVCRFVTPDGQPAGFAPDNILARSLELLKAETGLSIRGLGELEFYLFSRQGQALYPAPRQRGYHATGPFAKQGAVLNEMIDAINRSTSGVKYGHNEVGHIDGVRSEMTEIDGCQAEQLEIELQMQPLDELGDTLVIARWLIRNIAHRHGLVASFAPKIVEDAAGNGMHVHLEMLRNGRSVMRAPDGALGDESRKLIAGLCRSAASLTAFGNTVSSSYLRLVPNHEAPTRVCWSDMNRSALVRVPLGWREGEHLAALFNPLEPGLREHLPASQTVELRSPDGSAQVHLLLAGMTMAAVRGFRDTDALDAAKDLYVIGDINANPVQRNRLPQLPPSCMDSAVELESERGIYESGGVFPACMIDWVAESLRTQNDTGMHTWLAGLEPAEREVEVRRILHKDLHKN
jgi:glutamine synthetase